MLALFDGTSTSVPPESRTVVFGAFDRHNLGDLLFAHVVAALLPGPAPIFAGIAERDLSAWGGHRVQALARLAGDPQPTSIIVAGGEVLSCEAWEAAVMVLPEGEANAAAARFGREPARRAQRAQQMLGTARRAPYAPAKAMFAFPVRLIYNAVGGVELATREAGLRDEVTATLRSADCISVRDRVTQAALAAQGIAAALVPDCGVLVAELFGNRIRARGLQGEPAAVRAAFPQGYLAVQFSADCEDDATLATLARALDAAAQVTGCAIVFFRVGTAPWHDALEPYRRAAQRMHGRVHVFESPHIQDICALIAGSRGFAGTSLHGHIVAAAFALPRVSFAPAHAAGRPSKQEAYLASWEMAEQPGVVPVDDLAAGLVQALSADPQQLAAHSARLAGLCREGCAQWMRLVAAET
jgi:hypothetical protein